MNRQSLARNFDRYFKVHVVNNIPLSKISHNIRHQVYCEELGWEATNASQQEIDVYDSYSQHCLLQHRPSGLFAGCIRLITPPAQEFLQLPCFGHYPASQFDYLTETLPTNNQRISEVSRLAVSAAFRRRYSEKSPNSMTNKHKPLCAFGSDESRSFPHIAIGLYLSALALAKLNNIPSLVAMMEPRLNKRFQRVGLQFEQIADEVNLHGRRATYQLNQQDYIEPLSDEFRLLFELLHHDIAEQISTHNNAQQLTAYA